MPDAPTLEPMWAIARIGGGPLVERLWRQRPGVVIVFSSQSDAHRVAMHRSGWAAVEKAPVGRR